MIGGLRRSSWLRRLLPSLPAVLLLGAASAHAAIDRGPYLQDVRPTSILVVFEGAGMAGSVVQYGLGELGEASASCDCQGSHCACLLAGLAPDTSYLYRVALGGAPVGPTATFRTAPGYAKPFAFTVYGDNRSDQTAHQMVIDNMMGEDYALVINTGDLVSSGEVESDWDPFFKVEAAHIAHVPFYAAVGNHEEDDGKAEIFERLFHFPGQESGSGVRTYYSFGYSNCHFVVLDNKVRRHPWYECLLMGKLYDECLTKEQLAWLEIDLKKAVANPEIDHVFIFVHEGPYSSKQGRTGSGAMRDLLPLFAVSKVKVIFSGHDHYFEHGITGNGIDYVISGGGGAPLYEIKPDLWNQVAPHEVVVAKSIHNYQVVKVEGPLITVTTFDVGSLATIEEFTVGEKPACVAAADCQGLEEGRCVGSFDCIDFACVWVCTPPPSCVTVSDCGPPPASTCPGHWQCPPWGQCQWICDDLPECTGNADCAGKAPLSDCPGGSWQCMDDVCEWACPRGRPEADASGEPDGGGADAGGEEADQRVAADSGGSPELPGPGGDGRGVGGGDGRPGRPSGPDGPLHPLPAGGGGCAAGGGAGSAGAAGAAVLLLLAMVAIPGVRRRWSLSRGLPPRRVL